jgi:hypothetical protein
LKETEGLFNWIQRKTKYEKEKYEKIVMIYFRFWEKIDLCFGVMFGL